jgi:N-acetylneuraminic acid mutarotase
MTGPYPGETPVPHAYVYNPENDRWRQGVEIPADRRRGGAGAVLHGDVVYLAAGIGNGHIGDHKTWLDALQLDTGRWERLPDAPRPRDHFQAVLARERLYLLAGRTSSSPEHVFDLTIGEVDVYDLATGTWTTLERRLPTPRAGNTAILVGQEILVIGGESGAQEVAHDEVEALDVETHEWREASPLRRGRHGTGVIRHAQALYVASGCGKRGGEPELDTLERLALPPAPAPDQP